MSALPIFSYNKIDSKYTLRLRKPFLITLLASLYSLSYILSDYWNIPESSNLKFFVLGITILLGVIWSLSSAGDLILRIRLKPSIVSIIIIIIIIAVNLSALRSSIPWRGDEDHHINKALHLMERIPPRIFISSIVIWIFILFLSLYKPKLAILSGCFFLLLVIINYVNNEPIASLRYPFINYWFISIPPTFFSLVFRPNHEFLFRIIPLTSVILLSLYFLKNLPNKNQGISLIWALSIGLMPINYYYASILYLELPAVLLMTIVCFNIEELVLSDFPTLKKKLGWYALLGVGFIKETVLPFIVCFLFVRLIYKLWIGYFKDHFVQTKTNNLRTALLPIIKTELLIAFSTLTPNILYLVLRNIFSSSRQYSPHFQNLWNFQLFVVYFRSFLEQFGLFFLFFLIGSYILFKEKKYKSSGFLLSLVLFYMIFFLLDERIYAGYSRFNLLLLPPIITASCYFIKSINNFWKISLVLSVITITISLIISPVNIDGSKQPLWGNYLTDTSEHYYPTREALTWIKTNYLEENLLVSGLYYPYYFDFYFDKLQWQPDVFDVYYSTIEEQDDERNLSNVLKLAEQYGFDHILFFPLNSELPIIEHSFFKQEVIFTNQSHKLVYISKKINGEIK